MQHALETVFATAFATAIRQVGEANFKRTSFFGSNSSVLRDRFKRAA